MQKRSICAFLVSLLLISGAVTVEAAVNPILPASAASIVSTPAGAAPASYLQAIKTLQENSYGENELKSFVYQIFSLFDRHADVNALVLLFADNDLYMRVPEGPVESPRDFEKWYANIGVKYQSTLHTVERIDVQIPAKGSYRVDLIVQVQALDRGGKYTSTREHHKWQIADGGGYWPRIVSYIVDSAQ